MEKIKVFDIREKSISPYEYYTNGSFSVISYLKAIGEIHVQPVVVAGLYFAYSRDVHDVDWIRPTLEIAKDFATWLSTVEIPA